MRTLVVLFSLCLAPVAISKTVLLTHMPLLWRATSHLAVGTTDMDATPVHVGPFIDVRSDKEKIGENVEDDTPKPVTTSDDVGAFVGTHMRELLQQAGLNTVDGEAAITIKGEVRQFFVRESSTYDSLLEVQLTVVDRDGNVKWRGTASGDAKRFGRSYKIENYYEVLSDAVVNTASSMLQSDAFKKALSTQK